MANNVIAISDQKTKTQKPSSSAFKQQKLPSWSPILTVGTVLPTFFLIGVAFIPIGIGLLVSSNQVTEIVLDYTACKQYIDGQKKDVNTPACYDVVARGGSNCTCVQEFTITEDIRRDVYLYYGLTNFYQNHRRYVKSRDDRQLLGEGKGNSECEPFARSDKNLPIAPCGAIANSLFNDTFILKRYSDIGGRESPVAKSVPVINTGIAWATDRNAKFRNPPLPAGETNLSKAFEGFDKPPNWRKHVWQLDLKHDNNNGYLNEGFIVWMRTAALPTFRKLYARVAHDKADHQDKPDYQNSLPKGRYVLVISYNFPVATFKGSKRFIISNTSWLGGKNPFIGIMYIVVGCVCLLLSAIFVFIHKKFGKSTNEILNITQRTPYIG